MIPSIAIASYPFGSHHGFGLFRVLDRCCDDWIIAFANSTYLIEKLEANINKNPNIDPLSELKKN